MRIDQLRREMDERGTTHFDKGKLGERMARLVGGIAVIKVGAATETELRERRHRVEDAVQAARAARTEGIVAGGGAALRARPRRDRRLRVRAGRRDRRRDRPARAGGAAAPDRPQRRHRAVDRRGRASARSGVREGLDASTGAYGDLFAAGVFDPVLVTRSALANAASIAKTILTTECIVSGPAALSPSGAEVSGLAV